MSDHVIIVGVKRGRERVDSAELLQMIGRQGRQQNGLQYSSDIILNDDDFETEEMLASKKDIDAVSNLSDIQTFCFHVLPFIVDGRVRNKQDLQNFYDRSLASYQEQKLDLDKVLTYLSVREAIVVNDTNFTPDQNGIIASNLYMHCGDVKLLRSNFDRVAEADLDRDAAIAWALGNLETIKIQGDFGDHREEISNFKSALPSDYDCEEGCLITSALWWCMMGNGVPGKYMANNVRQLKKQWFRIKNVLEFCDRLTPDFIKELDLRLTRNICRELVPFFSDPKMTKGRAMGLYSLGYSNADGTENVEIEYE